MTKTYFPSEFSASAEITSLIRTVLLKDDTGWVQVLLYVDALLDVSLIRQRLKRPHLSPVMQESAMKITSLWARLPALTVPKTCITLVDPNLTRANPCTNKYDLSDTQKARYHGDKAPSALSAWTSEWVKHYEHVNYEPVQFINVEVLTLAPAVTMIDQKAMSHVSNSPKDSNDTSQFIAPEKNLCSLSINEESSALLGDKSIISLTQRRLIQRIQQIQEVPPLAQTADKIIKLRVDPKADINELTHIIEGDPCLAAQVMSWASSPYYAPIDGIRSLHDAVVRVLGFDMVLNLALGVCLNHSGLIDRKSLFRKHSQSVGQAGTRCAAVMEILVSALPRSQRPVCGLASLAGLVSELGELILMALFPPHYQQLALLKQANQHLDPRDLERHCLGNSLNEVAASLLEQWNLPEEVIYALNYQSIATQYHEKHATYVHLLFITKGIMKTVDRNSSDHHIKLDAKSDWQNLAQTYRFDIEALIKQVSDLPTPA